ncbi:MAG: o-succinylbenzoate synthase [Acidobacteria bacterium]|nr:o-succinylbenzoate synthase [Acidobacteriota bacterium]MBI3664176.1 o-succinylbenzoate synthase [Acidobacteriota bacterium]
MKVQNVCLREIRMTLLAPFETSFDRVQERRIFLIEASVDGVTGWGEPTAGDHPYYSPETIETAWHIIRDFAWPALRGRELSSAAEVWDLLGAIRGHNMAKAGLETAIWDAEAKQKGIPLWKLLGGTREELPCGVSIGIKKDLDELAAAVEKELAAGYQRIKIKIKPGREIAECARLRERFPHIRLMVDANSSYRREDFPLLRELERFYLMMIEQPLEWDDIYSHAELQKQLSTPICLDECIHSFADARAALEIGACRIMNVKLCRVGGHAAARRIHDLCRERSVPVWCGGMLESGIGRAHNVAMSTLPDFTLPGDVSASKRYWAEDIIEPEVTVSPQGTIHPPSGPGIGFEPRRDLIEKLTVRKEVLS